METISSCLVYWLGEVEYQQAWDLQNMMAEQIAAGKQPPSLLLLEHPHTYTIGRRGGREHILWSEEEIKRRGIAVFEVDRGGDITYHGPGQLVGYPLLPLASAGWQGERLPQADFVGYVRKLEEVLIRTLAHYGINAYRREGLTGVWVNKPAEEVSLPVKIASIGVKVDARGVSRHGFALNVQPEMVYWQGIIPCGLDGVQMTAMAEWLSPCPSVCQVAQEVSRFFEAVFGCVAEWQTALPAGLYR
ncbi:MAG: lipoyl(octanoyl) transferase LipB [Chloroflexota bacterium]